MTWKDIYNLINIKKKKRKSTTVTILKRLGYRGLSHDPIANAILNTYFASVGKKRASKIPPGKK